MRSTQRDSNATGVCLGRVFLLLLMFCVGISAVGYECGVWCDFRLIYSSLRAALVNLRASEKMTAPRYQDYPPGTLPTATTPDGKVLVKVIAGEALGTVTTPVRDTPNTNPMLVFAVDVSNRNALADDVPRH